MFKKFLLSMFIAFLFTSCESQYADLNGLGVTPSSSISDNVPNTQIPDSEKQNKPQECIASFESFAYTYPNWNSSFELGSVFPLPPWQFEGEVPDSLKYHFLDIITSLGKDGKTEIVFWDISKQDFVIYFPETKAWEIVPVTLEEPENLNGTTFFTNVGRIYVTEDGNFWGLERLNDFISKYKWKTKQFELWGELPENVDEYSRIVFDPRGKLWVFIMGDGIYSYIFESREYKKHIDINFNNISNAALAPDGSIYFNVPAPDGGAALEENGLFQFSPKSNEIHPLEIPSEEWPNSSSTFVDSQDRLWFSSAGWRESNGIWRLIHPDINEYFENIYTNPRYMMPKIVFESSNNILWFARYDDPENRAQEGMAWYDPNTGEGCYFSSKTGRMIEDSNNNLWLYVEGHLYKYTIDP